MRLLRVFSPRLPPHPSRLRRATFPRQGGRLIGASTDTAVQSCKCQCSSLPPHGGRWLAGGQTDEGETERPLRIPAIPVSLFTKPSRFRYNRPILIHGSDAKCLMKTFVN